MLETVPQKLLQYMFGVMMATLLYKTLLIVLWMHAEVSILLMKGII